jgi:excisionase family DNA binding protein
MSELAWTPAELAEQFGCEIRIIYRLIHEGRIPHVAISPQRVIIPKKQLEQWLADEAHAAVILAELQAAS